MLKTLKSLIKSMGKAAYQDPEIKKFAAKHPKFSRFIKSRLTPDQKFGLYLTIGIIISFIFMYFFFQIVESLLNQESLIHSDLRIIHLLNVLRTPLVNKLMLFITYLGEGSVVFLGCFLIIILLLLTKRKNYAIALAISVLGGELFVWILKIVFHRQRPPVLTALLSESSFSFPSGHAFVAIAFYGLLTYFIFRESKNKLQKGLSIIFGIIIILSIGFSRIYLGVHWPSDVLASYASGAAWLAALITSLEIRNKFNHSPVQKKSIQGNIRNLAIIFFSIWIVYLIFFFSSHPLQTPIIKEDKITISSNQVPSSFFTNVSRYSEDLTGVPIEPINLIFIGNQDSLQKAFESAGWVKTDPIRFKSMMRLLMAVLHNKPYDQSPGMPSFWNTFPNDFAYEQPTEIHSISQRHHIHFWKTPFLVNNTQVWFATAHFDNSITSRSSVIFVTHKIDPAVDKEREKIKTDLLGAGQVEKIEDFQIVPLTAGTNSAGNLFYTDGKAYVIYLKKN